MVFDRKKIGTEVVVRTARGPQSLTYSKEKKELCGFLDLTRKGWMVFAVSLTRQFCRISAWGS